MIDWQEERKAWRKDAERYATRKEPNGCGCDENEQYWCQWCDYVMQYMENREKAV